MSEDIYRKGYAAAVKEIEEIISKKADDYNTEWGVDTCAALVALNIKVRSLLDHPTDRCEHGVLDTGDCFKCHPTSTQCKCTGAACPHSWQTVVDREYPIAPPVEGKCERCKHGCMFAGNNPCACDCHQAEPNAIDGCCNNEGEKGDYCNHSCHV